MDSPGEQTIRPLRDALRLFGDSHPALVTFFPEGTRLIREGERGDSCYFIIKGSARVTIPRDDSDEETEVALRFEDDLIGESALFAPTKPRTANIIAGPQGLTAVILDRTQFLDLVRSKPDVAKAANTGFELSETRAIESLMIARGKVTSESHLMSVVVADIHSFTLLSESVWEEQSNAFLFDLLELCEDFVTGKGGTFEEQGDGFKALFADESRERTATLAGLDAVDTFRLVRDRWASQDPQFRRVGLGVGICTAMMSVRSRARSSRPQGRVLSHAINVAAAMTKPEGRGLSDVTILLDESTTAALDIDEFELKPQVHQFPKLKRNQPVFTITRGPIGPGKETSAHSSANETPIIVEAVDPMSPKPALSKSFISPLRRQTRKD